MYPKPYSMLSKTEYKALYPRKYTENLAQVDRAAVI